jgi:uncharacterized phage protein gp47/JayE
VPTPLNLYSTYEDLMAYKLQNTSDELDKREVTSLLFNAFANNSLETVQMLYTLQYGIDMVFADTAPREYLIRRAAERGLAPFPATFAIRKGTFNIDVPIGSRFSIEDVNYTVIKKIDPLVVGEFELRAETAGIIGNSYYGALIPITYIAGLSVALLTDILIPGEDEESTEAFRIRYFNSFESTSFGGNRADYKRFTNAIPGVGGSKVYRAWNGGGTVKVVIVDSQFKVPSQALIDDAQNRIDPIGLQGEGVGTAPIDHIVTVVGATPTTIDVAFTITFETGWEWSDIEIQVQNMIDRYFEELGGIWASAVTYDDDHSGVAVRVSQLETRLLGIVGVLDVTNTLLNGQPNNVNLGMEEIPVRGTVIG